MGICVRIAKSINLRRTRGEGHRLKTPRFALDCSDPAGLEDVFASAGGQHWRDICFSKETTPLFSMSKKSAFTLVELMLVVAIIGDLAIVAVPAFMRSRQLAQNTKYMTDNRTACGAFEMYAAENNAYPPDTNPGVIPVGMNLYLQGMDWSNPNSLGAQWKWMLNEYATTAQVGIVFPQAGDDVNMASIDLRFDDGILTTGAFRKQAANTYTYTIEW
jgi:prepilin-type N-terminal cleavage/methylation domain-containing protein